MTTDQATRKVLKALDTHNSSIVCLRGGGRRYFDGPDADGTGPERPSAETIRAALAFDHVSSVRGIDI